MITNSCRKVLLLVLGLLLTAGTCLSQPLPRLVDVGAEKCIPCKLMAPILEELKGEYAGRMDVDVVDILKNPEEAEIYNVWMIPAQIFYNPEGQELFRRFGFIGKADILAKWLELGYDFEK